MNKYLRLQEFSKCKFDIFLDETTEIFVSTIRTCAEMEGE